MGVKRERKSKASAPAVVERVEDMDSVKVSAVQTQDASSRQMSQLEKSIPQFVTRFLTEIAPSLVSRDVEAELLDVLESLPKNGKLRTTIEDGFVKCVKYLKLKRRKIVQQDDEEEQEEQEEQSGPKRKKTKMVYKPKQEVSLLRGFVPRKEEEVQITQLKNAADVGQAILDLAVGHKMKIRDDVLQGLGTTVPLSIGELSGLLAKLQLCIPASVGQRYPDQSREGRKSLAREVIARSALEELHRLEDALIYRLLRLACALPEAQRPKMAQYLSVLLTRVPARLADLVAVIPQEELEIPVRSDSESAASARLPPWIVDSLVHAFSLSLSNSSMSGRGLLSDKSVARILLSCGRVISAAISSHIDDPDSLEDDDDITGMSDLVISTCIAKHSSLSRLLSAIRTLPLTSSATLALRASLPSGADSLLFGHDPIASARQLMSFTMDMVATYEDKIIASSTLLPSGSGDVAFVPDDSLFALDVQGDGDYDQTLGDVNAGDLSDADADGDSDNASDNEDEDGDMIDAALSSLVERADRRNPRASHDIDDDDDQDNNHPSALTVGLVASDSDDQSDDDDDDDDDHC
jgi:nitrogen fixation protein